MSKYTFTFKKGDINLEYITTDRESMERQFQIWVTCASVWAYNQEKIEKGLVPVKSEEITARTTTPDIPLSVRRKEQEYQENQKYQEYKANIQHEKQEQPETAEIEYEDNVTDIDKESQRIIQEYKAEMEAEARKKETEAQKAEFKQNVEQVVAKEEAVNKELSELYESKPETINQIQASQPDEADLENNFDAILKKSMAAPTNNVKEKQDERFLKVIKVKNVQSKLDYLIVTAYYLSEFERLDRFTLKLVNAKLVENLHESVDHEVLQEAIEQKLVECLPNYTNIPSATEYRLTEAGEEAFLNGSTALQS